MSEPKVFLKKTESAFFNEHSYQYEPRNIMLKKVPNSKKEYYPSYEQFVERCKPFVMYHIGRRISPFGHCKLKPVKKWTKNYISNEEMKKLKTYIHIKEESVNVDEMLKFTRKVPKDVYNGSCMSDTYESLIQEEIMQLLQYNNVVVSKEVEIEKPARIKNTYIPRTIGQCDLLLNAVVVELKSIKSKLKCKNAVYQEDFWIRCILQAWNYVQHLNFSYSYDTDTITSKKEHFQKIVVTDAYTIIMCLVRCVYVKDVPHLEIKNVYRNNNTNILDIASYITWFNFYMEKISENDIINDLRVYFQNNNCVANKQTFCKIFENYKMCVKANFDHIDNKKMLKLIIKASKLNIAKNMLLKNQKVEPKDHVSRKDISMLKNEIQMQKDVKIWFSWKCAEMNVNFRKKMQMK